MSFPSDFSSTAVALANTNTNFSSTPQKDGLASPTSVKTVDASDSAHEKAKLREQKLKQNHEESEELARAGDAAMERSECASATWCYSDAIRKRNTDVELYVKLATACVKNGQYEQGAFVATRALSFNPKNLNARYQRGLARFSQGLLKAAQIDFNCVLLYSASSCSDLQTFAATSLEQVNACIASSRVKQQGGAKHEQRGSACVAKERQGVSADREGLDFEFPRHEEVELDIAEPSDSEECAHVGNRVACWFYNRREMGCEKGSACKFMHAPDEKSVRDNLGRNVCVYLLLGSCRYEDRCVYSHCKEWLPSSKGWWTSTVQMDRMRNLVSPGEKNAKEQRELARHVQLQRINFGINIRTNNTTYPVEDDQLQFSKMRVDGIRMLITPSEIMGHQ